MKITPLEIKQQRFDKALRGFDVAEVQQFLALVSNEFENILIKNKELKKQIEKLSDRVKHYERVEEALHETLQNTKESVAQKMDNARLEAKNTVDKAYLEAEIIVKEAHHEKAHIRQNILRLLDKREEIIVGINSYLETALGTVNKFKDNEMNIFSLDEQNHNEDVRSEDDSKEVAVDKNNTPKFKFDKETDIDINFLDSNYDRNFPPVVDRLDDILDEID